ncbi:unnamed protein product, partial [Rotaria sordida]
GELHNLKCYSLTISYNITYDYAPLVVPLLRHMTHLEKLTLYLHTCASHSFSNDPILFVDDTNPFIDGTRLHNGFLIHMPQLHIFNFYISTENLISPSHPRKSNDDILRTFTNTIYGQTACIINYFNGDHMISSYPIIEYSHLTSLDIIHANIDYAEQFLLETREHLSRLTELKINYYVLKIVTMNFTRDETRRNCSKFVFLDEPITQWQFKTKPPD